MKQFSQINFSAKTSTLSLNYSCLISSHCILNGSHHKISKLFQREVRAVQIHNVFNSFVDIGHFHCWPDRFSAQRVKAVAHFCIAVNVFEVGTKWHNEFVFAGLPKK